MYYYTLHNFEPIIEECEGCTYIFERITDKVKCCRYSFTPKTEWFWFKDLNYPCARATHLEKSE